MWRNSLRLMPIMSLRTVIAILLLASALPPGTAQAQPAPVSPPGRACALHTWAFDEARTPPSFGESASRLTLISVTARSPSDASSHVDLGPVMNVGTQDFTMSHWYRTTFRQPSALGDVLGNRNAPSHGNFVAVRLRGDGVLRVELDEDEGGTNFVGVDSGQRTVNDGTWHHLAYTRRGGTLTLYIDGQPVARAATASGEPTNLTSPVGLRIGRTLSFPNYWTIPGAYADLRIVYGRALGDPEIRTLFGSSRERYGALVSR
jgi:hypothetical protein